MRIPRDGAIIFGDLIGSLDVVSNARNAGTRAGTGSPT